MHNLVAAQTSLIDLVIVLQRNDVVLREGEGQRAVPQKNINSFRRRPMVGDQASPPVELHIVEATQTDGLTSPELSTRSKDKSRRRSRSWGGR